MTDTLPINPIPWVAAADKIEGHWIQNTQHDGARMCLVGGLESCGLAPGEWLIARAVARHRDHAEEWNDAAGRTEAEVLDWLRTAEPITPGELADVFGPQWEPVCALVLRSARLTPGEATALAAAGAAALAAARALVVRDLIDAHGFTQAHYDLLTRPWRTVIGPVHPDDGPLP